MAKVKEEMMRLQENGGSGLPRRYAPRNDMGLETEYSGAALLIMTEEGDELAF